MNKKIMIIISILLIFTVCFSTYLVTKEKKSENFLISTDNGCNLETHHLEYNSEKDVQECVEGAIDLGCDFSKNHIEYNEEKKEPECVQSSLSDYKSGN